MNHGHDDKTTYTGKHLNLPELADALKAEGGPNVNSSNWANALAGQKVADVNFKSLGLPRFQTLNFKDKSGNWKIPECFVPFIKEAMPLAGKPGTKSREAALRSVLSGASKKN